LSVVAEPIDLYRTMVRIRCFEERAGEVFAANEIPGFIHLSLGQEACAAGVIAALRPDDYITATHRGHGHIIAKGGELGPMMAELYARDGGYCRGKGGSMHIFSIDLGVLGANGILGAGQPIACGAALSAKTLGTGQIAATFFGEGASAQGAVHEAMNTAAIWELPVLFVAELNGWAELSRASAHLSVDSVVQRAGGYGIPGTSVEGLDVREVHAAAREAVDDVRTTGRPRLLEVRTHRWRGHFEGDAQRYRDAEDLAQVTSRDPIAHLAEVLRGDLGDDVVDAVHAEAGEEVERAVEFARSSPWPAPEDMLRHVYAGAEEAPA
jgi:pyruvate dehydrogenase E1 component alpha subunit